MLIKIKVYPESKENVVIKKSEDSYVVKVKEKAERGEANARVKELLQNYFGVSSNKIKLLKGGKKPNKIFEIVDS
ncbi:hypothetical protein A3F32_01460 [Candidatus Roizmanbacteria bacterium RIFCSPHIGHO2_12_FULL_42_10]|uniref:Uncharacterized protein n=3 Tax=Candidatus Roizmaniibacteriota TaxID=1752723 RepID=A0A1F7GKZ4_9BACT|nr:MAG: hypothetical protein A2866_01390 [Candidatus Roizmanbacteria bacterium RIFCSPHIGHO2_01_FULL_39_8]OGK28200.1 MAG: hypothetical protein A3C28_03340 [Candidatus Roizmanbacteria bacterium RIFCSPHIGHO2_02_FULL_39_9]OGK38707.1 MAG: hypothetical protein A3F32_01460 [Candidatus Roizmanbacteria bacterium RIFCSPHIGHO2_12_FULL_42_10]